MDMIRLSHSGGPIRGQLKIGGSKSLSNRILILNALAESPSTIANLSDSDDTSTLQKLLSSSSEILDAHHAGTTFRFMTAYLSLQPGTQVLTGSDRMKQRPVGPLVEALQEIGADIQYLENEGYPPLRIGPGLKQKQQSITIRADMSSQFISALCMIAPRLSLGLDMHLTGELVSKPYLDMTLKLMASFGVTANFADNIISVAPQSYQAVPFTVESDWSSASYHFAIAAIATDAEIKLDFFKEISAQADSIIQTFCSQFGVESKLEGHTLTITSSKACKETVSHDFLTHPDIAQTIAVIAAAKGMEIHYSGLKTLAIKETDRVAALKTELAKVGTEINADTSGVAEYIQRGKAHSIDSVNFKTYQDHRMAMAFTPLALLSTIYIENPKVVNKSYPNFWNDLATLGFRTEVIL